MLAPHRAGAHNWEVGEGVSGVRVLYLTSYTAELRVPVGRNSRRHARRHDVLGNTRPSQYWRDWPVRIALLTL